MRVFAPTLSRRRRPPGCTDARTRLVRRLIPWLVPLAVALVAQIPGGRPAPSHHDPHPLLDDADDRVRLVLRLAAQITQTTPKAELVAEGRALFESVTVAKDGESCQSCHAQGASNPHLGTVMHPVTFGDFIGPRDPPSLVGVAQTAPYLWTATVPTLDRMVTNTILAHFIGATSQPADVTARQVAAIIAYLETLDAPLTDFDNGTLSPAADRGQHLFQGKAGCISCHGGPFLTDNRVHDTFVPQVPGGTDPGSPAVPGGFNTPTLRDLVNSAPYMHNGVFRTLREVVEFYNNDSSIAPLGLTPQEVADLVAYLQAL